MRFTRIVSRILPATLLSLAVVNCSGSPSESPVLTAEMPLHLEDRLDAANVVAAEVPQDIPASIEWTFDQPQPDWKALHHFNPEIPPPQIEQTEDALRVSLDEVHRDPRGDQLHGDIYVELPGLLGSRKRAWGTYASPPAQHTGLSGQPREETWGGRRQMPIVRGQLHLLAPPPSQARLSGRVLPYLAWKLVASD